MCMEILTDPNDPRFRTELDKLGAPKWFPQDAPTHEISIDNTDHAFIVMTCPICKWMKVVVDDKLITVDKGDQWAFHQGGMGVSITAVNVRPTENLTPFKEFLDSLEDDNE